MKTIAASGKTVEEALSAGLKQLGCDLSQVTHEVIDRGSPGLFGMFGRLAKIRMSKRAEEADDFAAIGISSLKEAEKKPAVRQTGSRPNGWLL